VLTCSFGSCATELFSSYGGGHYYAYCRPSDGDQWVEFNDSSVPANLSSNAVITKDAYVLFFRRASDAPWTFESLMSSDGLCRQGSKLIQALEDKSISALPQTLQCNPPPPPRHSSFHYISECLCINQRRLLYSQSGAQCQTACTASG
jgi:hypothetical protein